MVFGYYTDELVNLDSVNYDYIMAPKVYDIGGSRLVELPYQFYSETGRLILYFGHGDSTCSLDWEEFLHVSEMYRETNVVSKRMEECMNLVQMKYVHYYKELIGFDIICENAEELAEQIEDCEYYELKYSDVDGHILDSFSTIYVDKNIRCVGISMEWHKDHKHTDNILEVMGAGGTSVRSFNVELLPFKVSDLAINAQI